MSTVVFCDRCGKDTRGSALFVSVAIKSRDPAYFGRDLAERAIEKDLCLRCRDALGKFFERLPEEARAA